MCVKIVIFVLSAQNDVFCWGMRMSLKVRPNGLDQKLILMPQQNNHLSHQIPTQFFLHENEFLVETVRSRLQTHSNAPTKQSSFAPNTNTIFSTTAF
jgi:hypothetical protein